jgi:hypothetical protein
MTDEQINAAIAEACGWEDCRVIQKATLGVCKPVAYGRPKEYGYDVVCPSFATDLNAMHKAEESLKGKQFAIYGIALNDIEASLWGIRATALQRAEAFLRTLGKWEEGE